MSSGIEPPPTPSICTNGNVFTGNMAASVGLSMLKVFGISSSLLGIKTPMDILTQDITTIQSQTQTVINTSVASYDKYQNQLNSEDIKTINSLNESLQSFVNYQDQLLSNKITSNVIYIAGSYILLIVIIIFLLSSGAFVPK